MDHVLVAIDGSPDSLVALRWAGRFASATGRRLVVAYAWQNDSRMDPVFRTSETGAADPDADVVAVLGRMAGQHVEDPSVVARGVSLRGSVAKALKEEATHSGAALIVVGARGVGGARRLLLGSVSRELTTSPTHAVAVVPEHEADHEPGDRPILVGVDGSDGAARAVRWAGEAAKRAGIEVVAVHAYENPVSDPSAMVDQSLAEERRGRLEQEWCAPLGDLGVRVRPVLSRGQPRAVIEHVAEANRPLCGVFGSSGSGAITQAVLGGVTNELVRELPWPVVVIPSARDRAIWPAEQ